MIFSEIRISNKTVYFLAMSEILQKPMVSGSTKVMFNRSNLANFVFPNTNLPFRVYKFQRKTKLRDGAAIDISQKALTVARPL